MRYSQSMAASFNGLTKPLLADDDALLVARCQQGDTDAFAALYRANVDRVRSVIARYLRAAADLDDAVQDTFLKAFQGLAHFRSEALFSTWIHRIAVNVALNRLAKKSLRTQPIEVDGSLGLEQFAGSLVDSSTPESQLIASQRRVAIQQGIAELPLSLKDSLFLREIHGLSYQDIARLLRCPIGTVRSRIARARERLLESE